MFCSILCELLGIDATQKLDVKIPSADNCPRFIRASA